MDYEITLPESPFGQIFNSFNYEWLMYVWWVFALISLLYFLVVLYHWLRYELKTTIAISVIGINALVILILMGGALANLTNLLS